MLAISEASVSLRLPSVSLLGARTSFLVPCSPSLKICGRVLALATSKNEVSALTLGDVCLYQTVGGPV